MHETIGQVNKSVVGELVVDWTRPLRELIVDVLVKEVSELCGPVCKPTGGAAIADVPAKHSRISALTWSNRPFVSQVCVAIALMPRRK